jgi:hypothetical protein
MRLLPNTRSRRPLFVLLALATLTSAAGAAGRGALDYIAGGATRSHTLYVGVDDHYLTVRGDGRPGSDLDCWVYQDGELVDSDTDSTDYCVLRTPGVGTHQVRVKNYASTSNYYTVRQLESLRR